MRSTQKSSLLLVLLIWIAVDTHPAFSQGNVCDRSFEPVSFPLNDLGDSKYVRMDGTITAFTGGLYPNGTNVRPSTHNAAGIALAEDIVPLGKDGKPNPNGRIVMISVGMSNAAQEFQDFVRMAKDDPELNPLLALVNGAQPGAITRDWIDPKAETWKETDRRLNSGGLTPDQVQIAWVKNTQTGNGKFPEKIQSIQADLEQIARNLKVRYPNIKLAYFSSRTRSYTYWEGLSPEPTAFETGFAVKWMIEKQINGDPELNFDPIRGKVVAPYLSWGAYLWIDGLNPRSDGKTWDPGDLAPDCTHPSDQGSAKVVNMLMDFFKTDETTKNWFLKGFQVLPTTTTAPITDQIKIHAPLIQNHWMDAFFSLWNNYLIKVQVPY